MAKKGSKKLELIKKNAVYNSGYGNHGASAVKKALIGWLSRGGSPDDDTIGFAGLIGKTLRQRSRDLYMGGAPIATSALKTMRTSVVGAGLRLKAQIDADFLNITPEEAAEWQKNTEREFGIWCKDECDHERSKNFQELQMLAYFSALLSGDVFAALPYKKHRGHIYGLKVMLIEADRVDTPPALQADLTVRGGIKVDQQGIPTTLYICRQHPLDQIDQRHVMEYDAYPIHGNLTGRRNILQLMSQERPGQRRGVPFLAPIIEELKQLGRYTEAELMAAVISGMVTIFIESQDPEGTIGEGFDDDEKITNDENSYEMGNGSIIGLNPGERANMANPGRPNTAFDGFVLAACRQIGAALELPFEVLLKHFTASYSASRAAMLEAWRMFKMQRDWLANRFCQPIYEEWLYEAVVSGRIIAPGFIDDKALRHAYSGALWYGPSMGQIDPLKEISAATLRVKLGVSTREKEAAEMTGTDFEDNVKQLVREKSLLEEGGLAIESNDKPQKDDPADDDKPPADKDDEW